MFNKPGIYALIENRRDHPLLGFPRYMGQSKDMVHRWRGYKHDALNDHRSKFRNNSELKQIIKEHLNSGIDLVWVPVVVRASDIVDITDHPDDVIHMLLQTFFRIINLSIK